MSKFLKFEEIKAWQIARELVNKIYQLGVAGKFGNDFGFRDQIQRAAVSIMANIAEGFERGTDKEFKQFLFIAKGSCGEVRSLLYIGSDLSYIDKSTFNNLVDLATEISRLIAGFIKYLEAAH